MVGIREGTPASECRCLFLFRATRGEDPDERLFVRKPTSQTTGGRHFESHPVRDLQTLRTSRGIHPQSQAGTSGMAFRRSTGAFWVTSSERDAGACWPLDFRSAESRQLTIPQTRRTCALCAQRWFASPRSGDDAGRRRQRRISSDVERISSGRRQQEREDRLWSCRPEDELATLGRREGASQRKADAMTVLGGGSAREHGRWVPEDPRALVGNIDYDADACPAQRHGDGPSTVTGGVVEQDFKHVEDRRRRRNERGQI